VELAQDPRLRRGLMYALDREGLQDLLLPGVAHASADTFMLANDPRAPIVGQPFAAYRYDPNRALQEFGDGGWRRAGDGRMVNRAGEQVHLELRGSLPDEKELAFEAAGWRQLGFEVTEYIPPSSLARGDAEFISSFPTMETRARGSGEDIFVSFDGRLVSSLQSRWEGANTSGYANPALDRLLDRLYVTVDAREQGLMLKEVGELFAADLPAIGTYFRTVFAAVGKGVRALSDDYATGATGSLARGAHLWDKD
jgi:peptide/nickel transport system substrate-binding protein